MGRRRVNLNGNFESLRSEMKTRQNSYRHGNFRASFHFTFMSAMSRESLTTFLAVAGNVGLSSQVDAHLSGCCINWLLIAPRLGIM